MTHDNMPAYGLWVKDEALLDKAKVGDAIKFHAEKQGSAIVVTDIQPAQ